MTIARPRRSSRRVWAALITVWLSWGSVYVGMRVAVETIPPFWITSLRYVAAGVLLLSFVALRRGLRAAVGSPRDWWAALVIGGLLVTVSNSNVVWGEQSAASGLAAIIMSSTPVWMVVIGRALLREQITAPKAVGLILGVGGIAILIGPSFLRHAYAAPALAFLVASVSLASGTVAGKRLLDRLDPLHASGAQMLVGGLLTIAVALLAREPLHLAAVSPRSLVAFGYLVLVGSVIGFSAYAFLLKWASITLISSNPYVNPVVAVALGAMVLGERVTVVMLLGGSVIILGVVLLVLAQREPPVVPTAG